METQKGNSEVGTIAGIIIVIIVLIIGAVYFFNQRMAKQAQINALIQQEQQVAAAASTSDNISDIQSDAASVDMKNLGDGVNNLQ